MSLHTFWCYFVIYSNCRTVLNGDLPLQYQLTETSFLRELRSVKEKPINETCNELSQALYEYYLFLHFESGLGESMKQWNAQNQCEDCVGLIFLLVINFFLGYFLCMSVKIDILLIFSLFSVAFLFLFFLLIYYNYPLF